MCVCVRGGSQKKETLKNFKEYKWIVKMKKCQREGEGVCVCEEEEVVIIVK